MAEACTYSGAEVVSGIHTACEGRTTSVLASVLGRWQQGGEEGTGMGQEGTAATGPLGFAPSAPSVGSWVAVVASQLAQLLGPAEPVLARTEVTSWFALGVSKQDGRYSKLPLVQLVLVQLGSVLAWVRVQVVWGRKRLQAAQSL